jgi:hypothetical protein
VGRGVLAVHISNRHLDLKPVLAALAHDAHLLCWVRKDEHLSQKEVEDGKTPSEWAVMARRAEDLGGLTRDARWQRLPGRQGLPVWTDDYSNLISTIRLPGFRR